ncbi:hypothetical protein AB3Z07_15925 [Metabacillus halosaccharovorans]|nr:MULTISPECIES: hypothetical protein [Metabacillus]MCM3440667.1 hypothetical protein [Metabacillus halosaccharovorans]
MAKKHHNSPEQKAVMANKKDTEMGSEYAYKSKPAPGHKEQAKHKKV